MISLLNGLNFRKYKFIRTSLKIKDDFSYFIFVIKFELCVKHQWFIVLYYKYISSMLLN